MRVQGTLRAPQAPTTNRRSHCKRWRLHRRRFTLSVGTLVRFGSERGSLGDLEPRTSDPTSGDKGLIPNRMQATGQLCHIDAGLSSTPASVRGHSSSRLPRRESQAQQKIYCLRLVPPLGRAYRVYMLEPHFSRLNTASVKRIISKFITSLLIDSLLYKNTNLNYSMIRPVDQFAC